MPKISILPDILASQVAAGEVVERPASVVKEMVENAIDANARWVEVEIHKGGSSLIKVTDDGAGMSKEDALLSLERHATSKLKNAEQLAAITTMGFRGEALPSIASVSQFRLATREHTAVEGTEVLVDGGVVKDVKIAGLQPGTMFEVRQLFFNVPARRKFMRAESTESAHVEHQMKLHALAFPEIRFTFKKDGRIVFDLPKTNDRRARIAGIIGASSSKSLIEVLLKEDANTRVSGFVLPAEFARKGRRQQYFFLNGRPIEDSAISRALKDAFKGAVNDSLNPTAWLWIEMDPRWVDVNVHPAKKEVRFHKPFEVRQLVMQAVEDALKAEFAESQNTSIAKLRGEPQIISRKNGSAAVLRKPFTNPNSQSLPVGNGAFDESRPKAFEKTSEVAANPFLKQQSEEVELPMEESTEEEDPARQFQILGVLHERYLLMQGEEGLVMLDPRAAKERIVYESFVHHTEEAAIATQGLLVPELIELEARDMDVVLSHLENFTNAGIAIEPFGGSTLQVRSMPSILNECDTRVFLTAFIDELVETEGGKRAKQMAYETFAEKLAKKAARNEPCKRSGAEQFLSKLFACELPYCAPDGRPTLVHISLKELERKFS